MKRLFDIILSLLFIILLSPIFIILIIVVSVTSKGGPFFTGERIGKDGHPFKIIKFRSMKINSEGNGAWNISANDERITKVGLFLRKSKLDELPQLFNILFGQMSFVGPRPELPIYVSWYSDIEKPILENKPGLTDWASIVNSDQVVAFTSCDDPDYYYVHVIRPLKLKLQLYYHDHHSLFGDLRCILLTALKVVFKKIKNPKPVQEIIDVYNKELKEKELIRTKIEYLNIPKTNLNVSRMCFGGCPMGRYGWGKTDKNELIEAVRYAIDIGINFFDTSDTYGLGESERILGEAIKGRRNEIVIATKFGVRRSEDGKTYYDNSPNWIKEALQNSLERLQTNYIDIYLVHYFDGKTPINEIFDTLKELQQSGKIKYYGVCNVSLDDMESLLPYKDDIVCIQNEYSLLTKKNEKIFEQFNEKIKTASLTWGSLSQGLLAGNINKNTVFEDGDRRNRDVYINFHGDRFTHNLEVVDEVKKIAAVHNKTCAAVSLRFVLEHLVNSVVLVGVKNVSELKSDVDLFGFSLSKNEIKKLINISQYCDNN